WTILAEIRKVLNEDQKIEAKSARIRLINFDDRAIQLELYAYFLTSDNNEFLALREDLFLKIAEIVESSGRGFAQPTEFLYLEQRSDTNGKAAGIDNKPQLIATTAGVEDRHSVQERAG